METWNQGKTLELPPGQWVLHTPVITTVGTPRPKYSCHCLSLLVPLLASSQGTLVSQLFCSLEVTSPAHLQKEHLQKLCASLLLFWAGEPRSE